VYPNWNSRPERKRGLMVRAIGQNHVKLWTIPKESWQDALNRGWEPNKWDN